MQKFEFILMAAAISLFMFIGESALSEVIAVPNGSKVIVLPPKPGSDPTSKMTMRQWLKHYKKAIKDDDDEEITKHYDDIRNSTAVPNPGGDFTPAAGSGPFAQTAKECGEAKQRECAPSNFGGRTMCGLAVAKMIKCMAPSIGGSNSCSGSCGHGKDFVACSNGQMAKCGYTKIEPRDERCKQAGAVLSYTKSPTARGAVYGHVEFVCGDNKYCSVYRAPHERPWPRAPADSCWFPKSDGGNKGGSK